MPTPASDRFTAQQHQILNAWGAILDDIRHLCDSLKALPDTCPCGDGRAHLSGVCVCCHTGREEKGRLRCEDCDSLLARLQPAINQLTVDTWEFFPSALEFLDLRGQQSGRVALGPSRERHIKMVAREEAVSAVERQIAAIVQTFDRLVAAVDEFRIGCRATHLHSLKAVADDLLAEVERFDRAL